MEKIHFNTINNDDTNEKKNKSLIDWCGRKYKITYLRGMNYRHILSGKDTSKIETTIEGELISYDNPFTGRFFLKNNNGALEIIPMVSIIEMREIN